VAWCQQVRLGSRARAWNRRRERIIHASACPYGDSSSVGQYLRPGAGELMSSPLRILQVTDFYEPYIGGMEQHVKVLSHALAGRGHEVVVATSHLPGTVRDETVDGVRIRRLGSWSSRALAAWYERADAPFHPPVPDPGMIAALRRIIDELRPDIVHTQGWITYSCLAMASRLPFRLVVTIHDQSFACARRTLMRNDLEICSGPRFDVCLRCAPGLYGPVKGTAIAVGLRAARPLHHQADSWVAASRSVAESSRRVLPRGSAISIIPSASAQPAAAGRRPSWLPADGYLLFVGTLGRHKGLNWLLDAYTSGRLKQPLVVIGTVRHDTPKTWPPGVIVRTSVPHPQVIEAWRHAGIGLVPSLCNEGFGLVAVEAMRSGVPVVASRIGALPEIVADGVTGILVTPGSTTELLDGIRLLEDDPALRRTMGSAGLLRAEQFSPETVTRLYEDHYRQLLAGRREADSETSSGDHPGSALTARG
jgi:glycosyltransferase involved in cell wall biosynthesis